MASGIMKEPTTHILKNKILCNMFMFLRLSKSGV